MVVCDYCNSQSFGTDGILISEWHQWILTTPSKGILALTSIGDSN